MTTPVSKDVTLAWSADQPVNDGVVTREDAALKHHLQGIRVRDSNSPPEGRTVPVYFRLPEHEARRREYPYITIDLITVSRDPSREHRGDWYFMPDDEYTPPGHTRGEMSKSDYPIPMLVTYQVTHFARFVQHDRQLMIAMITTKLPERFGAIEMVGHPDFPDDNSIRRLDLVNGPVNADSPDPADPNKRIFRKAYTIEISSEMFKSDINGVIQVEPDKVVLDVNLL